MYTELNAEEIDPIPETYPVLPVVMFCQEGEADSRQNRKQDGMRKSAMRQHVR